MSPQNKMEALLEQYDNMKKQEQIILENHQRLLINGNVKEMLAFLAGMFRELFADIACVITLNLRPDSYEKAFSDSKIFPEKDGFSDLEKELRILAVAKVISQQKEVSCRDEWEAFFESHDQKKEKFLNMSKTMEEKKVVLKITKDFVECLVEYGNACARDFYHLACRRANELKPLRQLYQEIIHNPEEVLTRILLRYYE